MKKDIEIPTVNGVYVAIVQEYSIEGDVIWNVYLVNDKEEPLENTFTFSDDQVTGAEDAAAYKIAKKRAAIMKDFEKEMVRPMKRPAAKILPENHVPREG